MQATSIVIGHGLHGPPPLMPSGIRGVHAQEPYYCSLLESKIMFIIALEAPAHIEEDAKNCVSYRMRGPPTAYGHHELPVSCSSSLSVTPWGAIVKHHCKSALSVTP